MNNQARLNKLQDELWITRQYAIEARSKAHDTFAQSMEDKTIELEQEISKLEEEQRNDALMLSMDC